MVQAASAVSSSVSHDIVEREDIQYEANNTSSVRSDDISPRSVSAVKSWRHQETLSTHFHLFSLWPQNILSKPSESPAG